MVDVGTPVRNGPVATPDDDWPTQAADTIERVVGTVRDKTTGPALTVSRALVYGTFAVIVGVAALVLVVIVTVRLLDSYLPDAVFGETHTWAAHLITGLVFTIAGLFAWSKRSAPTQRTEETGAA
jgi:predicted metal-binding membrane protein